MTGVAKRINNVSGPERRRNLIRKLARRTGYRCFYCARPFTADEQATFDHYIPYRLWRTGRHDALVLACQPCNERKADALPWPLVWLLLAQHHQAPALAA
ncbi:HNH endonuclease [Streptomyces mexicanus]|uniref:HNH endonuclease n=1 Tax=Streptomyces mexicanus TaxID=178566 RepID=A0A7X1LS46_9ACTN|nr:HNH endonuclease [Streptomyces mexicanus]